MVSKNTEFCSKCRGAGANALADVIPSLKAHIGLLEPSPAKRDLKPQSENITSRNGVLPPEQYPLLQFLWRYPVFIEKLYHDCFL